MAFPVGITPASLSKKDIDTLCNSCEAYAASHIYAGPPAHGNTYNGWPLIELVKQVIASASPAIQSFIAAQLQFRHQNRYGMALTHNLGGAGGSSPANPPSFPSNREMLKMRMRWSEFGEGFEHVDVHMAGDTVHVWIITKNNQSKVFEDGAALFPSDALVTKLNMIKQE